MRSSLFSLLLLLASACTDAPSEGALTTAETEVRAVSLNWTAIADKLVERMYLQPGERVLLVGLPGAFDPLVPVLRERLRQAGGEDLGALSVGERQPQEWSTDFTAGGRGKSREELVAYFGDVDLAIMLPGATPADAPYAALQDLLRQERGRTIHFHWAGAYDLNGKELPVDDRIDAFYQRVLLETDYDALAAIQLQFEEAMRRQTVQVTTPAGTDITFRIGDRPVTRQDGDVSAARMLEARNLIDREVELPAGAIRVAPIEETVAGTIAFPDARWNGQPVQGLVMTFEAGKLVGFHADSGGEAVAAELEAAGAAGKSFREFALGFNPLLAIPASGEKWIPYYGYGAGVVRLSLGDNTELGGKVGGGYVRWNFFPDATVRVGEEVWVENGGLQK